MYFHVEVSAFVHIRVSMFVTVVVRSQVAVLVSRVSAVEATRCPYQEAGWTGNPEKATNVITETYLNHIWTLQWQCTMYQSNKSVRSKRGKGKWTNTDKWGGLENQMTVRWEQNKRNREKLQEAILFGAVCSVLNRFNPCKASPLLISCRQFTDWQH